MTTLLVAFAWGFGISCGIFVWLLVWSFVRPRLPGEKTWLDIQERSLLSLQERNEIGENQITVLVRIAEAVEKNNETSTHEVKEA